MAELLLELLSEEIPARMQARAADDLKRLVTAALNKAGLDFESAAAYVTPRRLALVVNGLPTKQPDVTEERKGPRVGAPDKAIQGFLKSVGLASLDQCEVRDTGKGEFHFAVIKKTGRPTAEVVVEVLPKAISALAWPKSMRWANKTFRWIRPLKSILAVFCAKVLPGELRIGTVIFKEEEPYLSDWEVADTLPYSTITQGHQFLEPDPFAVKDFADYKKKLEEHKVLLDPAERRARIAKQADELAAAEGLSVRPDEALVAENAGLVEWPVVLMGRIDPAFMELPPEVLTTAMRSHQKYFALTDADGKLAPRFLLVANIEASDGGKQIVAGNERVLRARLADAKFFWDHDRKRTLASRAPALKRIVFHEKLGSLDEKVDRVQALAVEIAARVPGADKDRVRSAARLAKADLTTGMVGEFPELQGIMGRYYALNDGEHAEVAAAIADHYAPLGPNDRCPTAPVSVAVALADKIDTLLGLWLIGEKPTGSKDPFALRRATLGVIRLIIENDLRISLYEVLDVANKHFPAEIRARDTIPSPRIDVETVSTDLLAFFIDRLKVHLRQKGVRHDLISAVFAVRRPSGGLEDNLVQLLEKVDAVREFLASDAGEHLLTAYKRAANIVRIEEKRYGEPYEGASVAELLRQNEEIDLHVNLAAAAKESWAMIENKDFTGAMAALAKLRRPVDRFFDAVTVNCDEPKLRANRLRLLSEIRDTLDRVADFSKIEGVGGA